MTSLVLTVVGLDRPGLVDLLSNTIRRHDANWLESRMAQLAGQFAGIVHVHAPEDRADALTDDLVDLQGQGLLIHVTRSAPTPPPPPPPELEAEASLESDAKERQVLTLELIGHDRPGIVRDVAAALAARRINVVELQTQTSSAPMSGEPLFKATATLHAPPGTDADELHDALDQVADSLDLDLSLDPVR
jgi:glycine cleavage system regulatory protein